MSRLVKPVLMIAISFMLAFASGCLGERYESNVPAADLNLWDDKDDSSGEGGMAGRPRYHGNVIGQRGSLPARSGSLPYRGSMRGSLPNRSNRGSLPNRGLKRGSLPGR